MKSFQNNGERSSSESEGMDKTEYKNRKKVVENIDVPEGDEAVLENFKWHTLIESPQQTQLALEPFLKGQFNLYGGTLKLEVTDV